MKLGIFQTCNEDRRTGLGGSAGKNNAPKFCPRKRPSENIALSSIGTNSKQLISAGTPMVLTLDV